MTSRSSLAIISFAKTGRSELRLFTKLKHYKKKGVVVSKSRTARKQEQEEVKLTKWHRVGIAFVALGVSGCIVSAYYVSQSFLVLLGFLPGFLMYTHVRFAGRYRPKRPLIIGAVELGFCLLIITAMIVTHHAWWLVWLIPIALIGDRAVKTREPKRRRRHRA